MKLEPRDFRRTKILKRKGISKRARRRAAEQSEIGSSNDNSEYTCVARGEGASERERRVDGQTEMYTSEKRASEPRLGSACRGVRAFNNHVGRFCVHASRDIVEIARRLVNDIQQASMNYIVGCIYASRLSSSSFRRPVLKPVKKRRVPFTFFPRISKDLSRPRINYTRNEIMRGL